MPKSRRDAGSVEISLSPWKIRPEVWMSSPAIARSSVVLPQPDGPRKQTNSPGKISSEMSLSAANAPNCLVSRSMRRYGAPPVWAFVSVMAANAARALAGGGAKAASRLCSARESERYFGADLLS